MTSDVRGAWKTFDGAAREAGLPRTREHFQRWRACVNRLTLPEEPVFRMPPPILVSLDFTFEKRAFEQMLIDLSGAFR